MRKSIILNTTILLVANIIGSYSTEEIEFSCLSLGSKNIEYELKISEKYLVTDWMCNLGKNLFNNKSLAQQQHFRQEITQYSHQIAEIICKDKKNKETIAFCIRQIANDESPMRESLLDQNVLNHQFSIEMEKILYKIITNQLSLVDGKIVDAKFLLYWTKKEHK